MRTRKRITGFIAFGASVCLLSAGIASPANATSAKAGSEIDTSVPSRVVIASLLSGKCAAIPGGTLVPKTQAIQWNCGRDGDEDREWWTYDMGNDTYGNPIYVFQNAKTSLCLTSAGGNGGPVWQYQCDLNNNNQRWSLDKARRLHNNSSGDCLAVPAAQMGDGVKLIHWTCGSGLEQKWSPQAVG